MAKRIYYGVGKNSTDLVHSGNVGSYFSITTSSSSSFSYAWQEDSNGSDTSAQSCLTISKSTSAGRHMYLTALQPMSLNLSTQVSRVTDIANTLSVYDGDPNDLDSVCITEINIDEVSEHSINLPTGYVLNVYLGGNITNLTVNLTEIYAETKSVARKVKKLYRGVDNVARKVKKAYIGIGGVARTFFSGGKPTYYGAVSTRSHGGTANGAYGHAAASTGGWDVGDHAVFAGGYSMSGYSAVTALTSLYRGSYNVGGASVGEYAVFSGGYYGAYGTYAGSYWSRVHAYNNAGTRSFATSLNIPTDSQTGISFDGKYALFLNGWYNDGDGNKGRSDDVYAYDTSLTQVLNSSITYGGQGAGGVSIGNRVVYGGLFNAYFDDDPTMYCAMWAIDASLTFTRIDNKTDDGSQGTSAARVGNKALVTSKSVVDVYDSSLTRSTTSPLSTARYNPFGSSFGDYAIFAGGYTVKSLSYTNITSVDIYDSSLTRTVGESLPAGGGIDGGQGTAKAGNYLFYNNGNGLCAYTLA